MRQNLRRRQRNLIVLESIRKTAKQVRKLAASGSKADALKALSAAFAALDKAAKKNVIHRNNASRHKSRLAKLVGKTK